MDASIAVLGAGGRMGRIRCEAITSKGSKTKLAAVVDADAKALAELSRRYNVPGFLTLQEMLESNTGAALEAVWCCVRTDAHAKALQVAIAAGKHCAVEKPVAETEKEIREVYEAAERARVKLFCSFQRRADPLYARAAAQLRGKSLASIHTVSFRIPVHVLNVPHLPTSTPLNQVFRDHPTPDTNFLAAAGGCIFSDLLVHDVDYVRYVTGDEIARVVATSTTFSPLLRRAGVADFASALLTTNKGTQVLMELSRHSKVSFFHVLNFHESAYRDPHHSLISPTTIVRLRSALRSVQQRRHSYVRSQRNGREQRSELRLGGGKRDGAKQRHAAARALLPAALRGGLSGRGAPLWSCRCSAEGPKRE